MRSDEFDWKSGHVVAWDLDGLEDRVPLGRQLGELKEDLAQIHFPGERAVDVGWYPCFSIEGGTECRTLPELRHAITKAVEIAAGLEVET